MTVAGLLLIGGIVFWAVRDKSTELYLIAAVAGVLYSFTVSDTDLRLAVVLWAVALYLVVQAIGRRH